METADPGASQQCSSCDDPSAGSWCVDCSEALCDACVSAHRRVTVTRSHRLLNQPPAAGVLTPPIKFCRLHPSEQLKLFCLTCNQFTCRDCQLMDHMTHRYHFANEALGILKKQIEDRVQPIRVKRDTVRQQILDMETRLQDIFESGCRLESTLLDSYKSICEQLKMRMLSILNESKEVQNMESGVLQSRVKKLKLLQQDQERLMETADEALASNDLSALPSCLTQVESLMKTLNEENLSAPLRMSELKVIADRDSLQTLLRFGRLDVLWVPFSVSPISKQNTPAATPRPLPKTCTILSTVAPVSYPSTSTSLFIDQSNAPLSAVSAVDCGQPVLQAPPSHLGTPASAIVYLQPISTGLPPSEGPPPFCTSFSFVQPLLVVDQRPPQGPTLNDLLTSSRPVLQVRPVMPGQQASLWQQESHATQSLPLTSTAIDGRSEHSSSQRLPTNRSGSSSSAAALPPLQRPVFDIASSPKQQIPVIRAVADSACDHVVQVTAAPQAPEEDEPSSTVLEEAPSSVIGHGCLSQWQPRVRLFRLPESPPQPVSERPAFSLVPGDDGGGISMEGDVQVECHADDITEPESPATLQLVACAACRSAFASIVCSACGRGFHRDCHVPPVGPHMWSEWICSLCQDLLDPADPYGPDRPQTHHSPSLGVLDQRKCEHLLLHLKVEGCRRLSELSSIRSRLQLISENLTIRRSYGTAAEFLSDVQSLLRDASQDEDVLEKLQESFQIRLMETFGSDLHPSSLTPPKNTEVGGHQVGSEVNAEVQEVIGGESKLAKLKKRLRDFMELTLESKRIKTE